jgi:deoxyribodipyrimidine photo-lyase
LKKQKQDPYPSRADLENRIERNFFPENSQSMQKKRAIVWFRQDLRVHDNEALTDALKHADEIVPVFVFDERVFKGKTHFGLPKTGKYRAQFIIESVHDLRHTIRKLGNELIVRFGKPEEEIFELAKQIKSSWVYCNRERTEEEVTVQDALEKNLWSIGQEMRCSRGKMLYYTADLPFPVTHTPESFSQFRKEVERYIPIRAPLPVPAAPMSPPSVLIDPGHIPTLKELGHQPFTPDPRSAIIFKGGETEGLRRLQYYVWESGHLPDFKETKNDLFGNDYSSKFSAWLAQGCLSPKMIYHELKRYETEHFHTDSIQELVQDLMLRDFHRFMAKKHGPKIFTKGGIKEDPDHNLVNDFEKLQQWIEGATGVPFVDANMREIKHTGYMSNRGRQNVASFLIQDLGVNWLMGADYFESILIDYDPCSNYGNWMDVAGVGSDSRESRNFNILSQARRYDAQGDYVKRWLPALKLLPSDKIHQPDQLSSAEQAALRVRLGEDYPKAVVPTRKWG